MNIDYGLLGKRIKAVRKKMNITQEQLAEYLEVSTQYVSQVERGVTKISLDTLSQIAVFIDIDISTLITGTSINSKTYMIDEINCNVACLLPKERQMLNDFILLLKKNR